MDILNMIAQEHDNVPGFNSCYYIYYLLLYHFSAGTARASVSMEHIITTKDKTYVPVRILGNFFKL